MVIVEDILLIYPRIYLFIKSIFIELLRKFSIVFTLQQIVSEYFQSLKISLNIIFT